MSYRAVVSETTSPQLADLDLAKALSNPLRQRMLQLLERAPQSSTTLAHELGVTTGATSYHLRELARFGLVQETAPPDDRTSARERWWRHVPRDIRLPARSAQDGDLRTELDDLQQQWLDADVASFQRFLTARDDLGPWADALPFSRAAMTVNGPQLLEFFND